MKTRVIAGAIVLVALATAVASARATTPGVNGKLAFRSNRDGNNEIYVMSADGSGSTRLTSNPAPDSQPTWSPDGTLIAFTSPRSGNNEIYVMNADGSDLAPVTDTSWNEFQPAWSPDGSKIALSSDRTGTEEITLLDLASGTETPLTSAGKNSFPAWSPDGSKISFFSTRDGNQELYAMNADGSDQVRLDRHTRVGGAQLLVSGRLEDRLRDGPGRPIPDLHDEPGRLRPDAAHE